MEDILPEICPFCNGGSAVLSVKSFGKAGSFTTLYNCKCKDEGFFYQVIIKSVPEK